MTRSPKFLPSFYDRATFEKLRMSGVEPVASTIESSARKGSVDGRSGSVKYASHRAKDHPLKNYSKKSRTEKFVAVLNDVVSFVQKNAGNVEPKMLPATMRQIENHFQVLHAHLENSAANYFDTHTNQVLVDGKALFEEFHTLLLDEHIALQRKLDAVATMSPHLTKCSGAIMTAAQAGVVGLRYSACGLAGTMQLKKIQLLESAVIDHVRHRHLHREGDHVHFVNAYFNLMAQEFGVPERIDPYQRIAYREISTKHLADCNAYTHSLLQPQSLVTALADDFLERMHSALVHANVDPESIHEGKSLTMLRQTTSWMRHSVLFREFGDVPEHCYLIQHVGGDGPQYQLAKRATLITKHFMEALKSGQLLDYDDTLDLCENVPGDRALRMLGTLIWVERDARCFEVTLADLLVVAPSNILASLEKQINLSPAQHAPILRTVIETVLAQSAHAQCGNTTLCKWLDEFVVTYQKVLPPYAGRWDMERLFMLAADCGNADMLKTLFRHAITPDILDPQYGCTPLIAAVRQGHIAAIRCLIGARANLELKDSQGLTPVLVAVAENKAEALQILIDAGASTNVCGPQGSNAVMIAAAGGHVAALQCLIKKAATVDARDRMGCSAAMIAAANGQVAALQCLIDAGANVDAKNFHGGTPAYCATVAGRTATLQCLIAAKANLALGNELGYTPVIAAALHHQTAALEILIAEKADINVCTLQGDNALMIAVRSGDLQVIQILVQAGARLTAVNQHGINAMMAAVMYDDVNVLQYLIAAGAQLDAQCINGSTALQYAVACGNEVLLKCLLGAGADPDIKDRRGNTALMYARDAGQARIAEILLTAQSAAEII